MFDTKPLFRSITVLASTIIAILAVFNIHIAEADFTALIENAEQIVTAVLAIVAIYGRIRANKQIEGVL